MRLLLLPLFLILTGCGPSAEEAAEAKLEAEQAAERANAPSLATMPDDWVDIGRDSPGDQEWYEGGTLHKATAAQWAAASSSNRLATAGDWSATKLGESRVRQLGMNGLRSYAQQLVNCVNEATSDGPSNQTVGGIAAACAILMES
jgi:hypothetical protein